MFDFHRHLTKSETIDNALYATSKIEEWDKSSKYFSIGLLANNLQIDNNYYINKLEKKLIENKNYHIGEIPLDNRFNNLDKQIDFFEKALFLSKKYDRIFTIHIVQANNLLLEILEKNKAYLPKYIIYHGYNKSIELAKQLKKYNTIVSLNPKVINSKIFNNIQSLDKIGFLVESDWDKENDTNYLEYFSSFVAKIEEKGAIKYKDINNEFRSILENF